jgi:hypothetical protein
MRTCRSRSRRPVRGAGRSVDALALSSECASGAPRARRMCGRITTLCGSSATRPRSPRTPCGSCAINEQGKRAPASASPNARTCPTAAHAGAASARLLGVPPLGGICQVALWSTAGAVVCSEGAGTPSGDLGCGFWRGLPACGVGMVFLAPQLCTSGARRACWNAAEQCAPVPACCIRGEATC